MLAVKRATVRTAGVSLRTCLIAFVILIVLPAWGFAAYVASRYAISEQLRLEASGRSIAKSAAIAIDFKHKAIEAAMMTLTKSRNFQSGHITEFLEQSAMTAQAQQMMLSVRLSGLDAPKIWSEKVHRPRAHRRLGSLIQYEALHSPSRFRPPHFRKRPDNG